MDTTQLLALAAAVLAVVLAVRWVRSRSDRAPDLTMDHFSRALAAMRPEDQPQRVRTAADDAPATDDDPASVGAGGARGEDAG